MGVDFGQCTQTLRKRRYGRCWFDLQGAYNSAVQNPRLIQSRGRTLNLKLEG